MSRGARQALAAAGLYLAVRALGLLGLWLVARADGSDPGRALRSWDAVWITGIAEHGYTTTIQRTPAGAPVLTNIVFFPVMPGLMRLLSTLTGLEAYRAGLVVSAVAGAVAAVAVARIGALVMPERDRSRYGQWAGLVLVALWASWPHAIVLSMTYAEALFTALAAWCLWWLTQRRWLAAGLAALVAGATRPTGVALIGAVGVAAAVEVVAGLRRRRVEAGPLLAVVLAPLGWLGFVGWVGWVLGRPDGWFWMQRTAWLSRVDGGRYEWDRIVRSFTEPGPGVFVVCSVIILSAIGLLAALAVQLVRRGGPDAAATGLPLVTYAGLVVLTVLVTAGYHHSKPRFLLVAFPLLLPVAAALVRLPRPFTVPLTVLLLAAAAAASAWYGGYLLVHWTGSP